MTREWVFYAGGRELGEVIPSPEDVRRVLLDVGRSRGPVGDELALEPDHVMVLGLVLEVRILRALDELIEDEPHPVRRCARTVRVDGVLARRRIDHERVAQVPARDERNPAHGAEQIRRGLSGAR